MKRHIFVYKTTNLINGKIYIGVHVTHNITDSYLGSGNALRLAIKKYGKVKFRREILQEFDDIADAYNYEKELVNAKFIKRNDTYNEKEGGKGGQYGLVVCKLDDSYKVATQLEFDNNPNLSGVLIGKVAAKDKYGNCLSVSSNDPRFKSGELVGVTKGLTMYKDKDGNTYQTSKDDPRVISGELVGIKYGFKHSNATKQKMSDAGKNMVPVRDKDGNKFQVSVNDPRYLSGELVYHSKGQKRNLKLVTCPHCGKEGKGGNMTRYHFDNCRLS